MPARKLPAFDWEGRNNGQPVLQIEIWISWRYLVWRATHETFLKLNPKTTTVSELKVTLEKIWDNFPRVQLTKLSQVLATDWESAWGLVEDTPRIYYNSKKCSRVRCLHCLELRQFLITSKLLRCDYRKQHNFVSYVANAVKSFRFATKWMGSWCVKCYLTALYSC